MHLELSLVRTRQRGRHLHALRGRDAVKRVLVAPASAAQMRLRPSTQLHGGVRADDFIALLR